MGFASLQGHQILDESGRYNTSKSDSGKPPYPNQRVCAVSQTRDRSTMARFSLEAIVAIVGVIVTLPPSVILLWRLIGIGRSETPPRDVEALGMSAVASSRVEAQLSTTTIQHQRQAQRQAQRQDHHPHQHPHQGPDQAQRQDQHHPPQQQQVSK
ncbi:hypothetical protein CLAIMM_00689 [Cladophialophora immunda]|nr:hypothetical protein CLAIMM_00689 [Cladophialophora immunda]